jgi:integrase
VLVGELIDRWLATKRGLSPRGYRACLDASGHVRKEWGNRVAASITREEVQVWIAGLDWSPSMKHKLLQCLSGALALTTLPNPCVGVKTAKEKRREARWLTGEDLAKLAASCPGYEALIWTLGTTGLRIGEACALNVGDVDKRRGRLRVTRSKSGQGRDVPIPAKVLAMLDLSRPKSEPLFTARNGHRVLKDNFRARHFTPAAKRAGFPGLRIHDLRHAAASLAIASGAVPTDVATMLGHADPSITLRIYAERWDKGLDAVATKMDDLIGGER